MGDLVQLLPGDKRTSLKTLESYRRILAPFNLLLNMICCIWVSEVLSFGGYNFCLCLLRHLNQIVISIFIFPVPPSGHIFFTAPPKVVFTAPPTDKSSSQPLQRTSRLHIPSHGQVVFTAPPAYLVCRPHLRLGEDRLRAKFMHVFRPFQKGSLVDRRVNIIT